MNFLQFAILRLTAGRVESSMTFAGHCLACDYEYSVTSGSEHIICADNSGGRNPYWWDDRSDFVGEEVGVQLRDNHVHRRAKDITRSRILTFPGPFT